MTQPLPSGPFTHVCVVCHINGYRRDATQITDHRGHAVCDEHAKLTAAQVTAALTSRPRP